MKLHRQRAAAPTRAREPFIGKYIVENAKPAGKNVWKGTMTVAGLHRQRHADAEAGRELRHAGCAYVVICEDFNLIPAK